MIVNVSFAAGVAPVIMFTALAVAIEAAEPRLIVIPAVVTLPIETTPVAPDPLAIKTDWLAPVVDPSVIEFVCAVPPITIVPVVVDGPTAYVEAATPSKTKLPEPTYIESDPAPVASPIVIMFAASVPILMAFPPPLIDRPPDPATKITAPLEPPIVVVAAPEALTENVPS